MARVRIELFTEAEAVRLRRAGRVAAGTLAWVGAQLRPGLSTADIDRMVRADTQARGARPSQLGYQGFPAGVCTSRNHVVCHGIPSEAECLEWGDIINIDVTSCLDGFHGDTSRTFAVGLPTPEALHVMRVAEECLMRGIAVVRNGARLGDIGAAIEETAKKAGCSVVRDFGGHGIGRVMHAAPLVPHHGQRGSGMRLKTGMAFTIEPMINFGSADVVVLEDGWTVVTKDGSPSAQFEHSILVTPDGAEILTPMSH
jgi:methionyl aminopeptidase